MTYSSLAAIYEKFSPEQVGCPLASLWNAKIEIGKPRATKKCVVSREPIEPGDVWAESRELQHKTLRAERDVLEEIKKRNRVNLPIGI